MTTAAPLFLGYFPLWGARFDSDGVGLVGGSVMAYVPSADEWRQVSKSDVWIERLRLSQTSPEGPEPPLCLVVGEILEENELPATGFKRLGGAMTKSALDGVLALRLWKAGWFLDPGLAERIFAYGMFNQRAPGPYRQAFLNGIPSGIPPGYQLSISALVTTPGQSAPVEKMWQLIRQYRGATPNSSADLAIDNFQCSYGYQLTVIQRAIFLFMALDAMLGGMNAAQFRGVEINSSFRNRIAAALKACPGAEAIDSKEEAGWLDSRGRDIRNGVAHGSLTIGPSKAEESYLRIQSIVRLLLRQYLEFSVKWATRSIAITTRLGIPQQSAPAAAYNKILDVQAFGNTITSDLLHCEISTS